VQPPNTPETSSEPRAATRETFIMVENPIPIAGDTAIRSTSGDQITSLRNVGFKQSRGDAEREAPEKP
jgi:hypothetical protein